MMFGNVIRPQPQDQLVERISTYRHMTVTLRKDELAEFNIFRITNSRGTRV